MPQPALRSVPSRHKACWGRWAPPLSASCQAPHRGQDTVLNLPVPCLLGPDETVQRWETGALAPEFPEEGDWATGARRVINSLGILDSTRQGNIKCDL